MGFRNPQHKIKNVFNIFFSFQDAQGSAKKRPALPEDHFDFDDPENGPSPSKRRMHDEVIFIHYFLASEEIKSV